MMASYQFIKLSHTGPVATITLVRLDRLNALTPAVLADISAGIDEAFAAGARALVLTGGRRLFCAGADILPENSEYLGLPEDLGSLLEDHYHPLMRKIAGMDIPFVTAINGPAVGAGVSLALAGDLIVMGRGAYLLLSFANLGLVPDAGATWFLARSLGRARTLELTLMGKRMTANEAKEAGLVTRVVADEVVQSEAQSLAARLAIGPTRAMGMIRRQVTLALEQSFDATLDAERDNQRICGRTEDFTEAISAFTQKRRPQFSGR